MKLAEARQLVRKTGGYRVHFEKREGGMLAGDVVPDRDESPFPVLADATQFAQAFATVDATLFVNIYVVYACDHTPVNGPTHNVYPPLPEGR